MGSELALSGDPNTTLALGPGVCAALPRASWRTRSPLRPCQGEGLTSVLAALGTPLEKADSFEVWRVVGTWACLSLARLFPVPSPAPSAGSSSCYAMMEPGCDDALGPAASWLTLPISSPGLQVWESQCSPRPEKFPMTWNTQMAKSPCPLSGTSWTSIGQGKCTWQKPLTLKPQMCTCTIMQFLV